jgi:branched-chain amino acid transport system substrate-binding protein
MAHPPNQAITRRLCIKSALPLLVGSPVLTACDNWPQEIKIGVAQPLSGPLAEQGTDMLNGAKLAVQEINAQQLTVRGRKLVFKIVEADDQASEEFGVQAANSLVKAGAVAVIGHLNSGVSMAAAPVYARGNIPQLAISTKPEYTQMGLATTFRLVANDLLQARALAAFVASLPQLQNYALVDDGTSYGKSLADNVEVGLTSRQKKPRLRQSLDDTGTDFRMLIAAMVKADVDTLVTTLADFQVKALIEQLPESYRSGLTIVGSDNIKTRSLPSIAPHLKGLYATSAIVEAREFPAGKAFLARFRKAFGADPIDGAHYAYDAIYVLQAAISRSGSLNGTKLIETLKRIDANAPVTQNLRFAETGEQRYGSISIYQARGGLWDVVKRGTAW